jgi:hypothetical protein
MKHKPHPNIEVANGLELNFDLFSVPAQACHGVNFTLRNHPVNRKNPVHTHTFWFVKFHFNIILPPTPRVSK